MKNYRISKVKMKYFESSARNVKIGTKSPTRFYKQKD